MISIIIPAYKNEGLLKKNLPGLLECTAGIDVEIIVVNNGSRDGSRDLLRDKFPGIRLIEMPEALGFSRAANIGAKEAKGELLLFLNSDVSVTPGFIPPLLAHFREQENIFAVNPKIIRTGHGPHTNESISTGKFRRGLLRVDNNISRRSGDLNKPTSILYAQGSAMLVDKDKFFKLGGFDEIFSPFYFEDLDICYRAWKMGWSSIYEPRSIVYHERSATILKHFSRMKIRITGIRNKYLFIWKNIHDPVMAREHILYALIPQALMPNIFEWLGLAGALRKFSPIPWKRAEGKKATKFSDTQVFAQFKELNRYM